MATTTSETTNAVRRSARLACLASALVALTAAAVSARADGYIGVGFGIADDEILNEEDSAWKLMGGAFYGEHFGLELGFVDLGAPELAGVEFDQTALYVDAVGNLPLGERVDLFAKLGWFAWSLEVSGFGLSGEDDGSDTKYGAGGRFNVTRSLSIQAEFERYTGVQDSDVDVSTLSILWRF